MPELIAHTMVIGLSIAVIISMAAVLNVVRTDAQDNMADFMVENICYDVKLAAEQLREGSQPSFIRLSLPDKVGNEPYSISGNGHTLTVASSSATHTCTVGVSQQLSGTVSGTAITISLSGNTITLSV